jgi:hypothetical protein
MKMLLPERLPDELFTPLLELFVRELFTADKDKSQYDNQYNQDKV